MIVKSWDFSYSEDQRQQFRANELWREWAGKYPDIFDKDDLRLAKSQASRGYHFYEWLAAILIYQASGHLSLVEKYGFSNHRRKREILNILISPSLMTKITYKPRSHQPKRVQNPDLLVYAPDLSDWYFCEVKGKNDRLRPEQEEYFTDLQSATGRPVYIAVFKPIRSYITVVLHF